MSGIKTFLQIPVDTSTHNDHDIIPFHEQPPPKSREGTVMGRADVIF